MLTSLRKKGQKSLRQIWMTCCENFINICWTGPVIQLIGLECGNICVGSVIHTIIQTPSCLACLIHTIRTEKKFVFILFMKKKKTLSAFSYILHFKCPVARKLKTPCTSDFKTSLCNQLEFNLELIREGFN